jgi:disulfide bond formation protein DsbB
LKLDSGTLFTGAALACVGAVCAALFTQHVLGMQPCPWCVLQRLIFVTIALAALVGLALRSPLGRRVMALAMGLLGASGVTAALWQNQVAAKSDSCNLTLADRIVGATGLNFSLPEIFEARASCADAAATLLGLPYEFWSLTLFALLVLVAARLVLRPHP